MNLAQTEAPMEWLNLAHSEAPMQWFSLSVHLIYVFVTWFYQTPVDGLVAKLTDH